MRSLGRAVAVAGLLLSSCSAFEDTSPLIIASSHRTPHASPLDDAQSPITISGDHFHTIARQLVSQCASQLYILVHQPGLHVTDFTADTVPYLRNVVTNAVSKITADYGHGEVHLEDISDLVANKCGAESILVDARRSTLAKSVLKVDATFPVFEKSEAPRVLRIEFDELPGAANRRKSRLADNDAFLHSIMTAFPNSPNYTLIYTSSPSSHVKSHKRAGVVITQDDGGNSTRASTGGLFQKYQFFTPAIFMGLMAAVTLVPILLVAVRVVSSLKIAPYEPPRTQGAKKTQ